MIAAMAAPPRAVILDSAAWDQLDLTSAEVIKGMVKELREKGIEVYFADVHAPVLDYARQTGLLDIICEDHVFLTVDTAVRHIDTQ
jgi:MFS superfamily sulfate permease-like transporter